MGTNSYVPALDGLRWLAVSLVMNLHWNMHEFQGTPLYSIGEIGWVGVDLFFAISGYLITDILFNEKRVFGSISFRNFWARRILRIWPAYFLAFLLYFFIFPSAPNIPKDIIYSAAFFFINFKMAWLTTQAPSGSILWSVSFEEQFYLIWPFIVSTFKSASIWIIALLLLLIAVGTRAYLYSHVADPTKLIEFLPFTRLDGFVFGSLIALLLKEKRAEFLIKNNNVAIATVAVGLLYLGLASIPNLSDLTKNGIVRSLGVWKFTFVGAGCALLVLATKVCLPFQYFFSFKPFTILGKYSYGAYLFHTLCFQACSDFIDLFVLTPQIRAYLLFGMGYLTTFAAGAISYHFFEKYFLNLKEKFRHHQGIKPTY